MRKRGRPARRQEVKSWTARIGQTTNASEPEPESGLEDDGLVFWPLSLGRPEGPRLVQIGPRPARPPETARPPRRRMGMTVLFAALFFAGAALTAAAGNEVATIVASSTPAIDPGAIATDTATTATDTTEPGQTESTATETTTTETITTETTTTETTGVSEPGPTETATTSTETVTGPAEPPATPTGDQPADGEASAPAPDPGTTTSVQTPASEPGVDPGSGSAPDTAKPISAPQLEEAPQPVLAPQPSAQQPAQGGKTGKGKHSKPAYTSLHAAPLPEQIEREATPGLNAGTVRWIDQPLPDPTPPSLRLSRSFARELRAVSAANGLDWSFLLAVLRAEHLSASGQVDLHELQREAATLAPLHLHLGDRETLLAYKDDPLFAERVLALKHYYSALGLAALVKGLSADRDQLAARLLADPRIDIYPGGREDISTGRLDIRVLAMIAFLADSFGDVRVSCLITGHRLYARPGVISAHIYGRAVDIAALDGSSILGHQQPGGVTEQATRQILLLPAEMVPRQVISLIGLGGPSFPLADHNDHIHIGY